MAAATAIMVMGNHDKKRAGVVDKGVPVTPVVGHQHNLQETGQVNTPALDAPAPEVDTVLEDLLHERAKEDRQSAGVWPYPAGYRLHTPDQDVPAPDHDLEDLLDEYLILRLERIISLQEAGLIPDDIGYTLALDAPAPDHDLGD